MSTDMNNTPAFPLHNHGAQTLGLHVTGMSLRDYFAAKAMQATVQAWIAREIYPPTDFDVAENAYGIADAMMEARK